jgi:hypothetical protein
LNEQKSDENLELTSHEWNPTVELMTELTSEKADKEFVSGKPSSVNPQKPRARSSSFKYYIHDSVEECQFQLLGHLTEIETPELEGCWRTAKSTLGDRRLVLDLQRLETVDEIGRQWLAAMAGEGATYVPESFLRSGLTGRTVASQPPKPGFFARLFSIIRGSRILPAESSTQAQ